MIQHADDHLGRILRDLDWSETVAVVLGDNGTRDTLAYPPGHGKRTLYEGGVNLLCIVRGVGVTSGTTDALANTTDFYATFVELGGGVSLAEDSHSLLDVFRDPTANVRDWVYFEMFGEDLIPQR